MKATLLARFLQKLWRFLKAVLLEKVMWADYPNQLSFKVPTVVLVVLAGCGGGEGIQVLPVQPSIILIMADDLGYESLGVNGSKAYSTPNLDALAESGMRFTSAYATPLCTPTRVQLMTGKYNFRNYVGFGILDPGEQTFGHYLQEAGYATFIAGKWQLYGNPHQQKLFNRTGTRPEGAGFDEHYVWQIDTRPGSRFKNPGLNLMSDSVQTLVGAYGPDVFADTLIGFVKRHKDVPFFAYYPMALTHDPFQPTPGHPEYDDFDPATMRVNDSAYFADNVAYMDKVVGRIADALDEIGIREKTLILFIGDNGTDRDIISPFGDGEIQGNKGYPTKYGTHVPMIASWPGTINSGQVNNNLIDFTDFVPTLMDVANAKLPEDGIFDGLSFHDQLMEEADTVRSWVFCHYAPQWGNFDHTRFVHNRTWKLYGDGRVFNVATDPMELKPMTRAELKPPEEKLMKSFEEVLERLQ